MSEISEEKPLTREQIRAIGILGQFLSEVGMHGHGKEFYQIDDLMSGVAVGQIKPDEAIRFASIIHDVAAVCE